MESGNGSDGAGATTAMASAGNGSERPWEYSLRKYLLLLATLVATVTYTAGFTPPGGVWEEKDPAGHYLAGDPILRHTSYARYVTFFYANAAAFASSLVVIVLILILSVRHEMRCNSLGPVAVLRGFMVLDLVSLMVAYTAGIYRDRDVPVYTMVLAALTVVYLVVFHMVLPRCHQNGGTSRLDDDRTRKVLMLLATFAVGVTYLAGLSAPGGFRDEGDRAGDPVLMGGHHETRLKAFVHLNSTAFFWSLLITVQLLDKNLRMPNKQVEAQDLRFGLLYASVVLALLGLVGAYATGSSRDTGTTIYVTLVGGALPACILFLHYRWKGQRDATSTRQETNSNEAAAAAAAAPPQTSDDGREEVDKQARSLVLLLATLAATITYQAGLDPPGGLWDQDGGTRYMAGDPILQTINPKRYNAFFYCNSVAFVASLLAIILVKKNLLLRTHALEAAMILDLFGLIGAYAAGSCREVSTSIYAMALAGAVLVYVVIHVVFFTLDHDTSADEEKALEVVEKRRKRLMLFAILAATITYQAGLTPPGGFFLQDDLAADPVLLHNFPLRYRAFFYCNSVSFMLSIAIIILLVNKNLYRPAIRSHAISVCTAAAMLSLVGAYAAGSTQYMGTSIKIFGLASAILIALVAVVLIFVVRSPPPERYIQTTRPYQANSDHDKDEKRLHSERKYLMLLGILAASVTYQAGLKPPGGVWEEDDARLGHIPGNPIMRDNARPRYLSFFYINSTSFVASVIVVILLLLRPPRKDKLPSWLLSAMNITIVLDLLGLLVAYAVGSARSWKATGYVFALVFLVLAYITTHVGLAHLITNGFFRRETKVDTSVGP
ncbi:unnamed protein product [Urochloa decumbens]|uniref:PGG domain-containing protein n=1 Tax=Urochloa decumbens TaxID=240449 RepID=A0ABC9AIR9_9POAL